MFFKKVDVINQYKDFKKVMLLLFTTYLRISPLQPSLNDLCFSQMLVRTYNCILMGEQPFHPLCETASRGYCWVSAWDPKSWEFFFMRWGKLKSSSRVLKCLWCLTLLVNLCYFKKGWKITLPYSVSPHSINTDAKVTDKKSLRASVLTC